MRENGSARVSLKGLEPQIAGPGTVEAYADLDELFDSRNAGGGNKNDILAYITLIIYNIINNISFQGGVFMSQSVKNYTFSLPIDLLNKLKKFSNDGYVLSVNAAVKEAIESYVKKLEKQHLYASMK
jgi:predicted DNA-binding protein